jgi:glutamate 5-kinase
MEMGSRPKSLSGKQVSEGYVSTESSKDVYDLQALAAIGQGRLIALWDNLFGQLGQPIAQVLLTRGDISDVCRGRVVVVLWKR